MPGVTFDSDLRLIVTDEIVNNMSAHLNDLVRAGGIKVFDSLCKEDMDVSDRIYDGRLFFRATVDRQSLQVTPPPIKMDDNKVSIIDNISNKGESFDAFMSKVESVLVQDPAIRKVISDYDAHHPGGGEILKRFIVSEGAFTLFEAAQRKKNEELPCNRDYAIASQNRDVVCAKLRTEEKILTDCTSEINKLKSQTPTDGQHKQAIKKDTEELKKKKAEATERIKELTKVKDMQNHKMEKLEPHRIEGKKAMDTSLKAARKQAADYREGQQGPQHEKRARL